MIKRMACLFTWRAFAVAAVFSIAMSLCLIVPGASSAGSKERGSGAANISETDRTEAVIKDLHGKLGVTDKQEKQWARVAQVMRENAKTMDVLMKTRLEKVRTMNAVEDLKSYSEVTDAHATGLKKFIPPFEALYASMSDGQKKEADAAFKAPDPGKKAKKK